MIRLLISAITFTSAAPVRKRLLARPQESGVESHAHSLALLSAIAGSAADTQLVSDYVRHFLTQHSVELEDGTWAVPG